jgi:hypothetical protein
MSSTSNVQNLLSNVFRPTFVYNTLSNYYQTKLELVNIDTVSANTITTYAVNVRDSNSNAYIGSGAGNPNSSLATSLNSNNTFVGTNAGASSQNVSSGVLVGYLAGNGAASGVGSIAIGANTFSGGNSNIYIGYGTGVSAGNNNIFIGPGITPISNTSNTLIVGTGATPTIIGDLTGRRIGINKSSLPVTSPVPLTLDVEGYARIQTGGLGINKMPGSFNLDVNGSMQVSDGFGVLTFSNSTTTISNTASYPNCNATLQVTGGFFSTSGTTASIPIGGYATIGLLKKGMLMLSVQDTDTGNAYLGALGIVTVVGSTYTIRNLSSNAYNIYLSNSTSNLQIANSDTFASHVYTYSITYFPSP